MVKHSSEQGKNPNRNPWDTVRRMLLGRRASNETGLRENQRFEKVITEFDIARDDSTSALRGRLVEVASQELTESDLVPPIGAIQVISWLDEGSPADGKPYRATSVVFDPARHDEQGGAVSRGLAHQVVNGRYRREDGTMVEAMQYVRSVRSGRAYSDFLSQQDQLPERVQLATLVPYQLEVPYDSDAQPAVADPVSAAAAQRYSDILACVADNSPPR